MMDDWQSRYDKANANFERAMVIWRSAHASWTVATRRLKRAADAEAKAWNKRADILREKESKG